MKYKSIVLLVSLFTVTAGAEVRDNFELSKPVYVEVKVQKSGSYLNVSDVVCKAAGSSDESFQNKTQCFDSLKTCGARLLLKQLKYRCTATVIKDGQEIDLGTIVPTENGFKAVQNDKAADELVRFKVSKQIEGAW